MLLRRLRLEASARADYDAVNVETRTMLEAYAAGVNAFVQATDRLPIEYQLLAVTPEPGSPGMPVPCSKSGMCSPGACGRQSSGAPGCCVRSAPRTDCQTVCR